jgi:hypothetical protein
MMRCTFPKNSRLSKAVLPLLVLLPAGLLLTGCPGRCQDPMDLGDKPVSADAKAMVPYAIGDVVRFTHSSGTTYTFTCLLRDSEWTEGNDNAHSCPDNVWKGEIETTALTSDVGGLTFNLVLSHVYNDMTLVFTDNLRVSLGARGWALVQEPIITSELSPYFVEFDTLTLGGNLYNNVRMYDNDYYAPLDSTSSLPVHLWYNTTEGILQFEYADGQMFTRQ